MYKCELCKKTQEANTPSVLVVSESKPKTYVNKYMIDREFREKESQGWEIVSELKACPPCASSYTRSA